MLASSLKFEFLVTEIVMQLQLSCTSYFSERQVTEKKMVQCEPQRLFAILCNICPKSLLKILVSLKDYLRGFVIACISLNWDFIFADHVCFKCIHSGSISVTY